MGHTQLKIHLERLVELELVLAHRGRQGQGYLYELAYGGEGEDGAPFLVGLLDASGLDTAPTGASTTATWRGADITSRGDEADPAGAGRGAVGPVSADGRVDSDATDEPKAGRSSRPVARDGQNADPRRNVGRAHRNGVSIHGVAG